MTTRSKAVFQAIERQSLYFLAPYTLAVKREPLSPAGENQMLVETLLSAISPGTELLFYRGQMPSELSADASIAALSGAATYPLKYGYSCVGRVIALGAAVETCWQDRLVFAFHPHESHFWATAAELLPLPSQVTPEQALFLPNVESAINFVMDGQPLIGERVLVFGQGVVGLLTTALLAQYPLAALVTVDGIGERRALSSQLGATLVLDPAALAGQRMEADLVFELSGNPAALDLAIAQTGFSGRVVIGSWYGQKRAQIDLGGTFHRSRIQLISSQVSTLAPALSGRWDKQRRLELAWQQITRLETAVLITQRIPFPAAAQAYALLDQHPEQALQVVLTYG
jgi:2-desacetyl-2-hydroxyethyl bacteriochlorophyllide A dehydrogenase